ncbi:MAG: hypothetical protein Q7S87_04705 [Agitococcus sp.]|nr:hypothetical protein [Agitococcus sp.]
MTAVTAVSDFSKGTLPIVTGDCAGDEVVQDYYIDVTTGQLTLNAMFDIGVLPAGHTISDAILIPDDLDSGSPAITLSVGIMDGTPGDATSDRTVGAEIFSASTAAQGATPTRASLKTAFIILPTDSHRSIGVKVAAAPTTAAAGRIRLRVWMHQSAYPQQF